MAGTLYIVATPIGNLDDMPPRVAATFGAADFIAAEDTRVTMKLLNFLGLKKPMVSYYDHALQKGEGILRRIEAGENCALCSDAGMPCVSDPGEVIVRDALARGIKVVPVPAASACVTALAVSGQDTSRWVFEGFLPVNKKQKRERLAELQGEKRTVIFYEAPHKLRTTLDDLTAAFGPERSITLCRELTKLHEEIWKTTLGEAQTHYAENDPRGEYVLVMAGAPAAAATAKEFDDAYTGVLYGGFMLTAEGPKLLEFNARFGDPETQVIMPRLESDALETFYMVATGKLDALDLRWTDQVAVCVVLASDGYPGSYEKGKVILGIEEAEELDGVTVFHAGTAFNQDDELVTNGGRVLNVVALADTFEDARELAYEACDKINFEGKQYRHDIALRALEA